MIDCFTFGCFFGFGLVLVSFWLDLVFGELFLWGLFSAGVMFGNFIHGTKSILWVLCFQNDFGVVFLLCLFPLFFLVLSGRSKTHIHQ